MRNQQLQTFTTINGGCNGLNTSSNNNTNFYSEQHPSIQQHFQQPSSHQIGLSNAIGYATTTLPPSSSSLSHQQQHSLLSAQSTLQQLLLNTINNNNNDNSNQQQTTNLTSFLQLQQQFNNNSSFSSSLPFNTNSLQQQFQQQQHYDHQYMLNNSNNSSPMHNNNNNIQTNQQQFINTSSDQVFLSSTNVSSNSNSSSSGSNTTTPTPLNNNERNCTATTPTPTTAVASTNTPINTTTPSSSTNNKPKKLLKALSANNIIGSSSLGFHPYPVVTTTKSNPSNVNTNNTNTNTTTTNISSITANVNISNSTTTTNNNEPNSSTAGTVGTAGGKQLLFIEENGKTRAPPLSSQLLLNSTDQFEISCLSCRAKHRKCSKELPACSYCVSRGINCVYRKPKKKGRQSKKELLLEEAQADEGNVNSHLEFNEMQPTTTSLNDPSSLTNREQTITVIPSSINVNTHQQQQQFEYQQQQQQPSSNSCSINNDTTTTFDPNIWINQIRSSLQTNDNSNDMNMLHSLLTSDSISNIFSLTTTNLFETIQPTQQQPATTSQNCSSSSSSSSPSYCSINNLTDDLMKRLTLEDYCKSTSFPVIDKSEVSSLLFNEKRNLEATALLYSIHALMCQRKGLKHEADSAYQQARLILSKVFDNDFLIACAYCNLSVFCSGEGNLTEAKYYLKFVDYYFENSQQQQQPFDLLSNNSSAGGGGGSAGNSIIRVNNFNLRMLKTVAEMSAGIAAQQEDAITDNNNSSGAGGSVNNPIAASGVVTEGSGVGGEKKEIGNLLIGFYKLCTGDKKPPQPLLDIVSKTVTGDTLKLYMTFLELVSKLFYQHEMERNLSDEHSEISQRVINSFIHGTRVLILQECGICSGPIIEESANRLINISCEDNYGTAYSVLLCAIAAACRVHLNIVRDIKQGLRRNSGEDGVDYFEMIKKGLKALTLFSTRYGRVNKMYRSLILELQEVEREYSGFKLCLLTSQEIERLKKMKMGTNNSGSSSSSSSMDVPLLSRDDIMSIYYLVSPEEH